MPPRSLPPMLVLAVIAAVLVVAGCSDAATTTSPPTSTTLAVTSTSVAASTTTSTTTTSSTSTSTTSTTTTTMTTTTTTTVPPPLGPDFCSEYEEAEAVGAVATDRLDEISGLVTGWANDDVLWVHNDSGDAARVYALGGDGGLIQTFTLTGVDAMDWEDIAIGPGPAAGVPYLYVADIGDNDEVRDSIVVYRFAEPLVGVDPHAVEDVVSLRFRYPDVPRDAEALLVDPLTGDLLIVTKSLSGRARVFRASGDLSPDSETILEEVAGFRLGIFQPITAGDIGRTGDRVALRTYSNVWLWPRLPDQDVAEVFGAAPCRAPLALEPQGEAIGFDHAGRGYYTVSEGTRPPVHYYAGP